MEEIDLKLFDNQGVAVCLGGKGVELDEDDEYELCRTGWGVPHIAGDVGISVSREEDTRGGGGKGDWKGEGVMKSLGVRVDRRLPLWKGVGGGGRSSSSSLPES